MVKNCIVGTWIEGSTVWNDLQNTISNSCDTWYIGEGASTGYGFLKANAYVFRVYGRDLTDKEVEDNYSASVAYRELLNN